MSRRINVTLSDEQYDLLQAESRRAGLPIAELARRAIDRSYPSPASANGSAEEFARALDESFGIWADRDFDGEEYVNAFRRGIDPDFIKRLAPD